MLPFLKKQQEAGISGVIMKHREPDEKPDSQEDDPSAALEACASSLINGIHNRDARAVAEALRDILEITSEPQETSPHSYDDQK